MKQSNSALFRTLFFSKLWENTMATSSVNVVVVHAPSTATWVSQWTESKGRRQILSSGWLDGSSRSATQADQWWRGGFTITDWMTAKSGPRHGHHKLASSDLAATGWVEYNVIYHKTRKMTSSKVIEHKLQNHGTLNYIHPTSID